MPEINQSTPHIVFFTMNSPNRFKALALACAIGCASQAVKAADNILPHMDVAVDMRADWVYEKAHQEESNSGFHGRYLNLHFNATITDGLTFHWRQRLNKFKDSDSDVFSSTDWAYLNYQPWKNFAFSAGKEVVLVGGFEYDAAPIDILFASNFWNNIACYQFGVAASYISNNGRHTLSAQVTNSPYQEFGKSCYAYNLFWKGNFGAYSALWSVNMMEYKRGTYVNIISLGNRLELGDLLLELDVMNRYVPHHKYWFSDYTVVGKAEYKISPTVTIMAKGGKDDIHANPGTHDRLNKEFVGGGLEFYPLHRSRNLRLHAVFNHTHHLDGSSQNQVSIGVKWRLDIYKR